MNIKELCKSKLPTRVLSVKNPWAYLICSGIKDIENRYWKTNFRGTVFINVPSKPAAEPYQLFADEQADIVDERMFEILKSYNEVSRVIGSVEIVDCVENHSSIWAEKNNYNMGNLYDDLKLLGREDHQRPIYNFVLRNPILYDEPILNVGGKLMLWKPDFEIPDKIINLYV